jgi:hypothetical protein
MRYLKATILIGTICAGIVIVLFAAGWISTTPDMVLRDTIYKMTSPLRVPAGAQILIIALLAYAAAWTTVDITRPILKAVVAFAAILLLISGSAVLVLYNVFYSPFPGAFAILVSFLIGLAYGQSGSGSRKKVMERLFGQRISRNVFNHGFTSTKNSVYQC